MIKRPNLLYKGRSVYYSKTRNGSREYHFLGDTDTPDEIILDKWRTWRDHYASSKDTLEALAEAWLEHRANEVRDGALRASSLRELRKHLSSTSRLMEVFGGRNVNQIKTHEIQKFVETGKRYQANRQLATLSTMLGWGVNRGYILSNPAIGVKRNKEMPRDRYVTDEEFKTVYRSQPEPIQDLMVLCYLTGLRAGDVLALTFNAVHEDYLCAVEGKTRKKVRFLWSKSLRDVVERIKARNPDRSPSDKMLPMTVPYAARMFRANFPDSVDDWKIKDLRAKSATDRDEPEMASYALGHGSQSLTNRHYLRNQRGRIVGTEVLSAAL